MPDAEEFRPRFGKVFRRDGTEQPLVFYATDDPNIFKAVDPKSENGLVLGQGDRFQVDYLGPAQTILFAQGNDQFVKQSTGHLAGPVKEEAVSENPEVKTEGPKPKRNAVDKPWNSFALSLGVIGTLSIIPITAFIWVAVIRYLW